MIEDDPNYRTEKITSLAEAERYKALHALGLRGVTDSWLLERYDYTASDDGRVWGTATFRKLIPIGERQ
ncbi:hypothetical protein [Rhizobium sp. No.120]